MNRKILISIAILVSMLCIATVACSAGIALGKFLPDSPTQANAPATTEQTSSDRDALFAPFWQAWDIVHKNYVDQPVDDIALMRGAIKGMMESLGDQHTSYMNPQEYKDANASLSGEYEGIGAWVNTDSDYLTINEPMPGSPAEKAGLKPGDKIVAIDGVDMTGTAPELARLKVLGPKGSQVVLTVQREGETDPFDVTVTRATIKVPSVTGKMLDGNIAYVRMYTFGDKTSQELDAVLKDLMAQKPVGLIFDLRNNGGGYLGTAVEVGSQFLQKDQVILYEQYGDGKRTTFKVEKQGRATEIPMVVLVNQYSASASEVVAGALQDHGRARLVGVQSYGKGSVQNWIPLDDEQGAVKVTIARWLTPNERQIHKIGLTPDVVVELTPEDSKAGRDPQLDSAVELLKK